MYEQYFSLAAPPFTNTPDPHFFYKTPEHEEALARMRYCAQYHKGLFIVSGDAGTGKTLLIRLFLDSLGQTNPVALVLHPQLGASELLREVHREFGLTPRNTDSCGELISTLQQYLVSQCSRGRQPLLLIDEAHLMTPEGFDAVRMLSNIESSDSKLIDIFLLGQPELLGRFLDPDLCQLHQRIFSTVQLRNLTREELTGYVRHRLGVAGNPVDALFTPGALDGIQEYSNGLPRLINQICDNALLTAYSAEANVVDEDIVSEVLEQMLVTAPPPNRAVRNAVRGAAGDLVSAAQIEPDLKRLSAIRAQLAEVEQRAATLSAEQERVSELKNDVSHLREKAAAILGESSECVQRYQKVAAELSCRLAELEQASGKAESIRKALAELSKQSDLARLEETLKRLMEAAGQADETARHFQDRNEDAVYALQDMERFIDRAEQAAETLRKQGEQASALEKNLEKAVTVLGESEAHVETYQRLAQELSTRLSALQSASGKAQSIQAALVDASETGQIARLEETLTHLKETAQQAERIQEVLAPFVKTIQGVENGETLQDLIDRAQNVADTLPELRSGMTSVEAAIAESKERLADIKNGIYLGEKTNRNLLETTEAAEEIHTAIRRTGKHIQSLEERAGARIEALQELTSRAEAFREPLERFEQRGRDLVEESERVRAQLKDLRDLSASGNEVHEQLVRDCRAAETLAQEIETRHRETMELLKNLESLTGRYTALESLAQRLETADQAGNATADALIERIRQGQEQRNRIDERSKELDEQNERAESYVKNLTELVTSGTRTHDELIRGCHTAQNLTREIDRRCSDSAQVLNELESARDGYAELGVLAERLEEAKTSGGAIEEVLKERIRESEAQGTLIEQVSTSAKALYGELRKTTQEADGTNRQVQVNVHQLQALISAASCLVDRLPQVQVAAEKLSSLDSDVESKVVRIEGATDRAEELIERLEAVTDRSEALADRLDAACRQADASTVRIERDTDESRSYAVKLEQALADSEDMLKEVRREVSSFQGQREQLAAEFQKGRKALELVSAAQKSLSSQLEEARAAQTEATAETENLQKQIAGLSQYKNLIEAAGAGLADAAARSDACHQKVSELDAQVSEAQAQIVALLAEPDRITATMQGQIRQMNEVSRIAQKLITTLSSVSLGAFNKLAGKEPGAAEAAEPHYDGEVEREIPLGGRSRSVRIPRSPRLVGGQPAAVGREP